MMSSGNISCPGKDCGEAFASIEALNDHVKNHEGAPTYACKQCNKTFHTSHQLNRHKNRHVNRATGFRCSDCGFIFTRNDVLKLHRLRHHSPILPSNKDVVSDAKYNNLPGPAHAHANTQLPVVPNQPLSKPLPYFHPNTPNAFSFNDPCQSFGDGSSIYLEGEANQPATSAALTRDSYHVTSSADMSAVGPASPQGHATPPNALNWDSASKDHISKFGSQHCKTCANTSSRCIIKAPGIPITTRTQESKSWLGRMPFVE
ncbi:hypothetical protein VDGE_30329 [Verticillium dahliae]|uniref:C2H2-type domain-containing protein n=1 Tax=Verticillium dahliae TaxID=27337 RepID=A0A444S4Z3_VERDA|nr:hypothetical protein VDGE_30329 [Verticillium dahliae]